MKWKEEKVGLEKLGRVTGLGGFFVIRLKFKTKHKNGGHKFVTAVYMFRPKFKPNHKFKTKHKYDMNPTKVLKKERRIALLKTSTQPMSILNKSSMV